MAHMLIGCIDWESKTAQPIPKKIQCHSVTKCEVTGGFLWAELCHCALPSVPQTDTHMTWCLPRSEDVLVRMAYCTHDQA